MTTISSTAPTRDPFFQAQAQRFLSKADNMACEIIAKHNSTNYEGPVVIRHYHHYNTPFWWYTPYYNPTYIVVPNDRGHRSHYKDDGSAILVGIVAAVVGGIALYGAGSAITRVEDSSNELNDTRDFKNDLQKRDLQEQQGINKAVSLKERICRRIQNSAIWDLTLRITMVAACATALAGAITSTPVFITAGVIAGLAIGAGMLIKWGVESSDARNYRDAQALRAVIHDLKN